MFIGNFEIFDFGQVEFVIWQCCYVIVFLFDQGVGCDCQLVGVGIFGNIKGVIGRNGLVRIGIVCLMCFVIDEFKIFVNWVVEGGCVFNGLVLWQVVFVEVYVFDYGWVVVIIVVFVIDGIIIVCCCDFQCVDGCFIYQDSKC